MIADGERTFPPISAGVSGASALDRGDPLSPTTTTTLGGMAYVHTHIYCTFWHGYTHAHTDTHTHLLTTHYTAGTVLEHGVQ